jgi:hypothetical protein
MAQSGERADVELDLLLQPVGVDFVEQTRRTEASVVDHEVDGPFRRTHTCFDCGEPLGGGEVGNQHLH